MEHNFDTPELIGLVILASLLLLIEISRAKAQRRSDVWKKYFLDGFARSSAREL